MSTVYPSRMTYFVIGNINLKILPPLVYRKVKFENYKSPNSYSSRIYFEPYFRDSKSPVAIREVQQGLYL